MRAGSGSGAEPGGGARAGPALRAGAGGGRWAPLAGLGSGVGGGLECWGRAWGPARALGAGAEGGGGFGTWGGAEGGARAGRALRAVAEGGPRTRGPGALGAGAGSGAEPGSGFAEGLRGPARALGRGLGVGAGADARWERRLGPAPGAMTGPSALCGAGLGRWGPGQAGFWRRGRGRSLPRRWALWCQAACQSEQLGYPGLWLRPVVSLPSCRAQCPALCLQSTCAER